LIANILPLFIYFLLLRHFKMQFYASFLQLKGEALDFEGQFDLVVME